MTTNVPTDAELAQSLDGDFTSEFATVNGIRLHYVSGGTGRPLVLMAGWPQNWWAFRGVLPALAAAGRRVIALDLPGQGSSDKPEGGYDKKSMAAVVHAFVRELGYEQVDIAGHDVGSQVAFSFAANHPEATRKVAMLDILHPDPNLYQIPMLPVPGFPFHPWWFAFNSVAGLPEQLIEGRARHLVDWIFDNFLVNQGAVTELDRVVYTAHYDNADAIRASNGWYRTFGQDIADLESYDRISAPILGLVSNLGDGVFAAQMQGTLPTQGSDVKVVVVQNAGHYFVEEAPQAVIDEFNEFFV